MNGGDDRRDPCPPRDRLGSSTGRWAGVEEEASGQIDSRRPADSREVGRSDGSPLRQPPLDSTVRTATVLALVVIALAGSGMGGALAGPMAPGTFPDEGHLPTADNESGEMHPGSRLAGLVGVQDATIRTAVNESAYDARLAAVDSPQERAQVVRARLDRTERRLMALERRRGHLEQDRAAGNLTAGEFRSRAARIAAATRGVTRILDRSEAALSGLPADERQEVRERIQSQREMAAAIHAGDVEAAAAAIDATDREVDARPIGPARVRRAFAVGTSAMPDTLRGLFGSERITVHVRRANGTVERFHVRTSNGRVVDSGPGPSSDPTLHVYTTHDVIRDVADADRPWATIDRALSADQITVRGVGIVGTLKFWIATAFYDLADGTGNLIGGISGLVGL